MLHRRANRSLRLGIALGTIWCSIAPAAENGPAAPAVWRFEFDNDLIFNTDDQLSAGWSIQRHSPAAADWSSVHAPRWLAGLGERIPGLNRTDHVKRVGIGIGQVIQTPEDLERESYIPDDVPYAASLGVFFSWAAISPKHIAGCQLYLGTIGEPALAEEMQRTVHSIFSGDDPQGWDNQIGFEPVVNLTYGS
ncbi:MAG: lipid A-modifier LpxR family protein, partial [Planctomycetota bacterium]